MLINLVIRLLRKEIKCKRNEAKTKECEKKKTNIGAAIKGGGGASGGG